MNLTNLHLEIHLLLFILLICAALAAGYLISLLVVNRLKSRILEVEDEMLFANKEILRYVEENKKLADTLEKAKISLPNLAEHIEDDNLRRIPLEKIS